MMRSLDDGVGRVMKAIRDARLDTNTLVIFTSDNGASASRISGLSRGKKARCSKAESVSGNRPVAEYRARQSRD